ncbi:putative glycerophosphoryl diester phosphodiesterase 2 [Acorus calamus]|uniref:glycerophosphodiester phosphodiesterase n=1 Tax=Acorus calamus TaxID=4465 RepID=A0AAV9CWM2_ACOCL|nr:putative glycerophosphoryl diester phosphodiesterase 2 [Acorus calamus]
MFYTQNNMSMRSFLISASKTSIINYVSSPEVGFLRSIAATFKQSKTKLIYRFLDSDAIDPSIDRSYESVLKNLTFIKTFASGILVPKNYIWPVSPTVYLESPTSIVKDAHKAGLEIYASDFANDVVFAYNYSYDPVAEYLSFVDYPGFSVDGVLTDFPVTASEAIGCFSHIDKDIVTPQQKPLVITHNGASGMYPGCTDLAYKQAVDDKADIIDCNVQITSDKVPVCLSSIDLIQGTTVAQVPPFISRTSTIPEIQDTAGIFTFNLTWEEIQKLRPEISNPEFEYRLVRNPAYKNAGSFWKLSDFLAFTKDKIIKGVMLEIENAIYLTETLGIGIVDIVVSTLSDAGYDSQTGPEVYISSSDSSVLVRLKQQTKYNLVYTVYKTIRDSTPSTIEDIKSFAHSVAVYKESIYPTNMAFVTSLTGVVEQFHAANLAVYSYPFRNEFVAYAWDFPDPTAEINSFVQGAKVDGVITDFPRTAVAYKSNKCLNMKNPPSYMTAVQPGALLNAMTPSALPPAQPPNPLLTDANVTEPPLPSMSASPPTGGVANTSVAAALSPPGNVQMRGDVSVFVTLALVMLGYFLLI